jgi:hypothetical protein
MFAHETARILSVSGGLQSDGFIAANIHNYATLSKLMTEPLGQQLADQNGSSQ